MRGDRSQIRRMSLHCIQATGPVSSFRAVVAVHWGRHGFTVCAGRAVSMPLCIDQIFFVHLKGVDHVKDNAGDKLLTISLIRIFSVSH